ncbi:RNA-binding domain-containing protein [Choiromyces venosus 120613-1]|uniref:RNA-binding domain-containing protein n=1 Tax=Choiromyces venosus 120613-1 TaxID=1336337 RepID=A0A3N4JD61_9PEZI|nr:RNA-binding domain-containing protein [Choiromyces venosus 120613-1]
MAKHAKIDNEDNRSSDDSEVEGLEQKGVPERKRQSKSQDDAEDDTLKRRTIFVRSLPYTATTESLSTQFSFIPPLKHATVVADPVTKKSRGFRFVTFLDAEDAQKAVKQFNGADFEGTRVKVEIAEKRHRETALSEGEVKKRKTVDGEDVKKWAPRLIVRNLPWSVKKPEDLVKIFQSYGKVRGIIPRKGNKPSGPMSGFAFVTMKGYKNAENAIEKTNGMEIDGRTVAVDWAVEKNEWEQKKGAEDMDIDEDKEEKEEEDVAVKVEDDEDSGVGVIGDEDAESMDNAPDASSAEGSDIQDFDDDENERHGTKKKLYSEEEKSLTVFIRNLLFSTDDETLREHFESNFGPIRYARIVMDHATERPGGTGFVCFFNKEDCDRCLADAPRQRFQATKGKSLLQNEGDDPSGRYTIDSRILQLKRAVNKAEAAKLQEAGLAQRDKGLKQLAREAAVGFAADAKVGRRKQLSKEELMRGGDEDREAERRRKAQGKGIVRQANVVEEEAGGGRRRGYGFIEYSSHRWALMGLRWLNGHEVGGTAVLTEKRTGDGAIGAVKGEGKGAAPPPAIEEKKKLTIEFAIENAQVVARRKEKEEKARERSKLVAEGKAKPLESTKEKKEQFATKDKAAAKARGGGKGFSGGKRKR